MGGGEITLNEANRQGGGVFVHWGEARFNASGNSTITGNKGTGSSKAICNRGITELTGNTTADFVYAWDHGDALSPQSFLLANNVQITKGIALAHSATNQNFITLANDFMGAGPPSDLIAIDLEGHLASGVFVGELEADWLHQKLIDGAHDTLEAMLDRLVLNTFTSTAALSRSNLWKTYEIKIPTLTSTEGFFEKIP
jgi:hypothetical protein